MIVQDKLLQLIRKPGALDYQLDKLQIDHNIPETLYK